jgi:uncharacterized protein (DUF1684 family)
MDDTQLMEHRAAKDDYFRHDPHSPLPHHDRHQFEGLHYFDPNPDLAFTVAMEPGDLSEIRIPTSDQREKVYKRAGKVRFDVGGQPVELTVFDTGHPGYFIPFRDQTSGHTTYGAGRYLDIDPNPDGSLTIDFNYAYNPSCVYSDGYSCPIPPAENWLPVPIEAGEKMWEKTG